MFNIHEFKFDPLHTFLSLSQLCEIIVWYNSPPPLSLSWVCRMCGVVSVYVCAYMLIDVYGWYIFSDDVNEANGVKRCMRKRAILIPSSMVNEDDKRERARTHTDIYKWFGGPYCFGRGILRTSASPTHSNIHCIMYFSSYDITIGFLYPALYHSLSLCVFLGYMKHTFMPRNSRGACEPDR